MCSLIKRWIEENMQQEQHDNDYQDYLYYNSQNIIECNVKETGTCCNNPNCSDCNTKFKNP